MALERWLGDVPVSADRASPSKDGRAGEYTHSTHRKRPSVVSDGLEWSD